MHTLGHSRFLLPVTMATASVLLSACGSIADTTTCTLQGGCTDASTRPDGIGGDTSGGDGAPSDAQCNPGDTKNDNCNQCVCSPEGTWLCTLHDCDAAPPPSKCPDTAQPGDSCTGTTHCIYETPCKFGCDCVSDKWVCGTCPG